MSVESTCPSPSDLQRLIDGRSSDWEARELGQHVQRCATCQATLKKSGAWESLIARLQTESPLDADAETLASTRLDASKDNVPAPRRHLAVELAVERLVEYMFDPPQTLDELGWLKHYRVLKLLGAGAMGLVLKATDTQLDRPVALKVLQPVLLDDEQARARFLREAKGMAAIRHDNVTNVYEVSELRRFPYFVMEYLVGETLAERIDREPRLTYPDVLRIGREIAQGLAAAHERGVIHRDVKPANIWLEDSGGRVKILDFGLARVDDPELKGLTAAGTIMGTPNYMAPEQARGDDVDARCDLFSLGCVLYHMSSGLMPFDGPSITAILTALAAEQPKNLRKLNPELPESFVALVEELLAKKREDRPESARVVVEALRSLEDGRSVPRHGRRLHRRAFTGIAAAGGVAAAFGLYTFLRHSAFEDPGGPPAPKGEPIRLGLLFALSGEASEGDSVVIRAVRVAMDEINAAGGLLGRPVEAVLADGESSDEVFAREAEQLIREHQVVSIIGCRSASSRRAVLPVVDQHDNLLICPFPVEGLLEAPRLVCNGAAPNQLVLPAIKYCSGFLRKKKFCLAGSDELYARVVNALIRDEVADTPVQVVGEEYLRPGTYDVQDTVAKIVAAKPDMVISTVVGETRRPFFLALHAAGLTPDKVPTLSFGLGEYDLRSLPYRDMVGDFAAACYFQSLPDKANQSFIGKIKERYGPETVVTDAMEAAFFGIHLWAQAVRQAGALKPSDIRAAFAAQSYAAPEGEVKVAPSLYTARIVRLGKVDKKGQFKIEFSSGSPVEPEPFPTTRTRENWQQFLNNLHAEWGKRWSKTS
ncbi:MAG: bifunctional serine/threonine-protein kinase/ABC transporter substrate-binding protein [Gemmataceae bacterium]